jgi:hypothetical protein
MRQVYIISQVALAAVQAAFRLPVLASAIHVIPVTRLKVPQPAMSNSGDTWIMRVPIERLASSVRGVQAR